MNGTCPTAYGSKPTTSAGPTNIITSSVPLNPSHAEATGVKDGTTSGIGVIVGVGLISTSTVCDSDVQPAIKTAIINVKKYCQDIRYRFISFNPSSTHGIDPKLKL
jgi:hypothetical protein